MSQFRQIIEKLQSIDCSVSRYCSNPEDIARAELGDYSGMSGRAETQFKFVHELVSAIERNDTYQRKALSHILSDGKLSL